MKIDIEYANRRWIVLCTGAMTLMNSLWLWMDESLRIYILLVIGTLFVMIFGMIERYQVGRYDPKTAQILLFICSCLCLIKKIILYIALIVIVMETLVLIYGIIYITHKLPK